MILKAIAKWAIVKLVQNLGIILINNGTRDVEREITTEIVTTKETTTQVVTLNNSDH